MAKISRSVCDMYFVSNKATDSLPTEAFELLSTINIIENNSNFPEKAVAEEVLLKDLGIAFTLPQGFTAFKTNLDKGFSFESIRRFDGLVFIIKPPEDQQHELQWLKKMKFKANGYMWEDNIKFGNNSFLLYRNPLFLEWCFWLKYGNRTLAYMYFILSETVNTMPSIVDEILSSIKILSSK